MFKFNESEDAECAFCGRKDLEDGRYVSSANGLFICEDCLEVCYGIMRDRDLDEVSDANYSEINLITPQEICDKLDESIVGQADAKKVLSVAVYNHYKRIKNMDDINNDLILDKSNVLMLGPTGCGKTLLAKTLADILNVPFAIADATTLTEAGYVGEDVENILLKLIQAADYDIKRAERGIVYIDEIDKICRKSENPSLTRDVSGEGVQQALLKIIESTMASVPPQGGRKHPQQECYQIDTTNILFICGGAFVGLSRIVNRRKTKTIYGFGSEVLQDKQGEMNYGTQVKEMQPDDLIKYGMIPEFVGRIPVIVGLDSLNEEALRKIMTEPKNSLIKQYKKLLEYDGVELEFTDEAILEISKRAIKLKTGARALRSIVEDVMLDIMFKTPTDKTIKKIVVNGKCITDKSTPEVIYRKEKKSKEKIA